MFGRLSGLLIWLTALLAPIDVPAVVSRSRSILIIDQPNLRNTFYQDAFAAFLSGRTPYEIPGKLSEAAKLAFNGKQMQRSGVNESDSLSGNEICLRASTFLEIYRLQSLTIAAAVLI